jgi:hypothetical protein
MPDKPTVRIEQVTPAMADKWLGTQTRNRTLREDRVRFWVEVIRRGEWKLTNDCIAFDTDGALTNGQHRLYAIHVSGETLPLGVMRNLEPEAQDIMDSGLQRKTRDALALRDEKNSTNLAAGLAWEHRLRFINARQHELGEPVAHYGFGSNRPSTPTLLHIFDEDTELWREMVKVGAGLNRLVGIRVSLATAGMRRFWNIDANDAEAFHEKLASGSNLDQDDPILQLRNLLAGGARPSRHRERMPDYREMALLIKAWNLWREGNRVGVLVWRYGGANHGEMFPMPK